MRARVKRRQTIRRVEIIAIVAIVAVSLSVGFYLALSFSDPRAAVDGKYVSQKNVEALEADAVANYGAPGTTVWNSLVTHGALANITSGSPFTQDGKPVLVYVGGDFCPFCAVQRWSLVLALMRFGNVTGLKYMTSALTDQDLSTITFDSAKYNSTYLAFSPYEVEDRNENPQANQTLPSLYATSFQDLGKGAFPFLNFGNQYYITGAVVDPSILGNLNQTQIIAAITNGNTTAGSLIKQGANVITALICKMTGGKPTTVCTNNSIEPLLTLTASYTVPSGGQAADLILATQWSQTVVPETYAPGQPERSWA